MKIIQIINNGDSPNSPQWVESLVGLIRGGYKNNKDLVLVMPPHCEIREVDVRVERVCAHCHSIKISEKCFMCGSSRNREAEILQETRCRVESHEEFEYDDLFLLSQTACQ